MSEVYGQLEETDCRVGVIASRSSCAQTTTALSLLQHAQYGAAKSLLVSTLKVVHSQVKVVESEMGAVAVSKDVFCTWQLCGCVHSECANRNRGATRRSDLVVSRVSSAVEGLFFLSSRCQRHSLAVCASQFYEDADAIPRVRELASVCVCVRERLWIDCCKELNRWNSLHELEVAAASRSKLSLQCASKLQHWAVIEKLLHTHKVADPATKLCQVRADLLLKNVASPSLPDACLVKEFRLGGSERV